MVFLVVRHPRSVLATAVGDSESSALPVRRRRSSTTGRTTPSAAWDLDLQLTEVGLGGRCHGLNAFVMAGTDPAGRLRPRSKGRRIMGHPVFSGA